MIRAPKVVTGVVVFGSLLCLGAPARADVTLAAPTDGPLGGWEVYTHRPRRRVRRGAAGRSDPAGLRDGSDAPGRRSRFTPSATAAFVPARPIRCLSPDGGVRAGAAGGVARPQRVPAQHPGLRPAAAGHRVDPSRGVLLDLGRDRDDQPADVPRQQPRRARGVCQDRGPGRQPARRARAFAVLARRRRDRLSLRSRLRPSAIPPASTSRARPPATSATASSPRCSSPASCTRRRSFTAFS